MALKASVWGCGQSKFSKCFIPFWPSYRKSLLAPQKLNSESLDHKQSLQRKLQNIRPQIESTKPSEGLKIYSGQ